MDTDMNGKRALLEQIEFCLSPAVSYCNGHKVYQPGEGDVSPPAQAKRRILRLADETLAKSAQLTLSGHPQKEGALLTWAEIDHLQRALYGDPDQVEYTDLLKLLTMTQDTSAHASAT